MQPLFRNIRNLYLYLIVWGLIAVTHAMVLILNQEMTWFWATIDSLIFNIIYALFGLSLWYTCRFISLEKLNLIKIVESHLFASLFASALWLGLSYAFMFKVLNIDDSYALFLQESKIWRGLIGVLFYFIIIAFYYVYIYSTNFQK